MNELIYAIAIVPLLLSLPTAGQQPPFSALQFPFQGQTQQQIDRRIFAGERAMISTLKESHPLLETYIQSAWPKAKGQSPIDDAYFLSEVDFGRGCCGGGKGRRGRLTPLFGGDPASKRIKVDNGGKWELYPDGYLDMLFVDLESFDADTYSLSYLQPESCNESRCLLLLVHPRIPSSPGRFEGTIWVETSTFRIVRIKGTFTSPKIPLITRFFGGTVPLYLNFDSIRQQVSPGNWLPSYVYFDENRTWRELYNNGETDFHYCGHTFMWGYRVNEYRENADIPTAILSPTNANIVATAGETEEAMDNVVNQILIANQIDMAGIHCRVLLSTPLELFSVGNTIFVSRGLLNSLPDDSSLPVFLAYEIAAIHSSSNSRPRKEILWQNAADLIGKTRYSGNLGLAVSFIAQLHDHSRQIPNLLRARFGPSLLDTGAGLLSSNNTAAQAALPLILRGKYTIDVENGSLRDLNGSSTGIRAESNLAF